MSNPSSVSVTLLHDRSMSWMWRCGNPNAKVIACLVRMINRPVLFVQVNRSLMWSKRFLQACSVACSIVSPGDTLMKKSKSECLARISPPCNTAKTEPPAITKCSIGRSLRKGPPNFSILSLNSFADMGPTVCAVVFSAALRWYFIMW